MTRKESDGTLERAALGLEFTWNVLSCREHSGIAVSQGRITLCQSIWTAPSASPSSRSLTPTCSSNGQGRGGARVSGSLSRVLLGLSPRSFNPPFSYLGFHGDIESDRPFQKQAAGSISRSEGHGGGVPVESRSAHTFVERTGKLDRSAPTCLPENPGLWCVEGAVLSAERLRLRLRCPGLSLAHRGSVSPPKQWPQPSPARPVSLSHVSKGMLWIIQEQPVICPRPSCAQMWS